MANDADDRARALAAQLAALSAQFASQLGGRLDELDRLFSDEGGEPTREALAALHGGLHKLAGSGGTFGFPELSRQARELEHQVRRRISEGQGVSLHEWAAWRESVRALRQTKPVEVDGAPVLSTGRAAEPGKTH